MKMILALAGAVILSSSLVFAQGAALPAEPFAVVELFASEGCSSCPPADELLGQIAADASRNHQRIYTLSFEVDYWDSLGWKDPYSSPLFTERQHQYAKALASSKVYTPQMIVNGQDAFVGSDASHAKEAIIKSLSTPAAASIRLTVDQLQDGLKINYELSKQIPNTILNIALVERKVQSHVTAGENEGRILNHVNVVRTFKSIVFTGVRGSIVIAQPQEKDLSAYSLIAYAQSRPDMTVLAATAVDL